jgi:ubiquinone/menaquinone biosynthesis C-methylase UbiE
MRMNAVETLVCNSPVRAVLQRRYEARLLERLGGRMAGGRALEIGCGRGVGVEIILDRFGADEVVAFDLDERMVRRARRRLTDRQEQVEVQVGDAARIDADDASFDAVFDFGIIHHVPDWRAAIAEVARVLRPGGRFYFEEVTRHALERLSYQVLFDHPDHDRFDADGFVAELEAARLHVGGRYVSRFFGDFVIGVAERRPADRPSRQR